MKKLTLASIVTWTPRMALEQIEEERQPMFIPEVE